MPCGGIYPHSGMAKHDCWVCEKKGAEFYCAEWDTALHRHCIPAFLNSPEGRLVIAHGHIIDVPEISSEVAAPKGWLNELNAREDEDDRRRLFYLLMCVFRAEAQLAVAVAGVGSGVEVDERRRVYNDAVADYRGHASNMSQEALKQHDLDAQWLAPTGDTAPVLRAQELRKPLTH